MAVAVKWLDLIGWELVVGAGLGVLWGMGLATVYRWNLKRKNDRRQLVGGQGGGERRGRAGAGAAAHCVPWSQQAMQQVEGMPAPRAHPVL